MGISNWLLYQLPFSIKANIYNLNHFPGSEVVSEIKLGEPTKSVLYLTITIKVILIVIKIKFYGNHRRLYSFKTGGLVDDALTYRRAPQGHISRSLSFKNCNSLKSHKIMLLMIWDPFLIYLKNHKFYTLQDFDLSKIFNLSVVNFINCLLIWVLGRVSRELNQWQLEKKKVLVQLIIHLMIKKMLLCIAMKYCLVFWLTNCSKSYQEQTLVNLFLWNSGYEFNELIGEPHDYFSSVLLWLKTINNWINFEGSLDQDITYVYRRYIIINAVHKLHILFTQYQNGK